MPLEINLLSEENCGECEKRLKLNSIILEQKMELTNHQIEEIIKLERGVY
jgi:hypothetical protein